MNLTLLALAATVVLGTVGWLAARRHLWTWAAGLYPAAAGCLYVTVTTAGAVLWYAGVALLVAAGLVGWMRYGRSSATVARWGARSRRTSGVATSVDIARHASARAMRKRAAVVRPSLEGMSRRALRQLGPSAYAVRLARVGGQTVWASVEDVVIVLGGPRTGKTGWMGGAIIDAPGAVVTTSTRLDLHNTTRPLRETDGRPVIVFNPAGLGSVESTLRFNPLTGCADPVVATERAADMIPESSGSGDRSYWDAQARRVLAAHLHAAALGGRTMQHVLGWIADPKAASREVLALLRESSQPSFAKDAEQFQTTNDKTQSSITSTVMPALGWLSSPAAVAAATTTGAPFDVAEFIRSRGTLYLLGRNESHTAPLMAGLVGYVCRAARRLAADQPGGRIDPTLALFLDEAGRAAPVPLDDWTGDAGGSGILIVCAFQSLADIRGRWGDDGAAKILNNATAVVLYGGTKDERDLRVWTGLAGQRDEVVKTYGRDGRVVSRTTRQVEVLTPAQLSNLPAWRAVVFRRGMPPVIGRPLMSWKRRDVKAAARDAGVRAKRARWETTLDTAWASSWVAGEGDAIIAAAEQLALGLPSPAPLDLPGEPRPVAAHPSPTPRPRTSGGQ